MVNLYQIFSFNLLCFPTLQIDNQTFDAPWEAVSIILAFLSLGCLIAGPTYFIWLQRKYIKEIMASDYDPAMVHKDASLFSNYRLIGSIPMSYMSAFFARRYMMVLTLMLLPNYHMAQIWIYMATTMSIATYIGKYRPFLSTFSNRLELFNEMLVFVSIYPIHIFTDFVWDMNVRNDVGMVMMSYILFSIFSNVLIIIVITIRIIIKKVRVRYRKMRQ